MSELFQCGSFYKEHLFLQMTGEYFVKRKIRLKKKGVLLGKFKIAPISELFVTSDAF